MKQPFDCHSGPIFIHSRAQILSGYIQSPVTVEPYVQQEVVQYSSQLLLARRASIRVLQVSSEKNGRSNDFILFPHPKPQRPCIIHRRRKGAYLRWRVGENKETYR